MLKEKRLTIFTPTYNRGYILPQLYRSLCEQDSDEFVWFIVDDGSTDGTEGIVREWQKENRFPIQYLQQPNGGKMRAHNRGVCCCQTELFVCVDSDDYLTSSTVVRDMLVFWDENLKQAERSDVCGMISYRKMENKKGYFPKDTQLLTLTGLYERGFQGETTLMFKTEILRQNPFPEIEGEKFITEAVIYDRLDTQYQYLLFPYFSQVCEYRKDGYTHNGLDYLLKNPKGYSVYYNQLVEMGKGSRYYNMRMYIACSLLAKDRKIIANSCSKALLLLMFPVGVYQYRKFLKKRW